MKTCDLAIEEKAVPASEAARLIRENVSGKGAFALIEGIREAVVVPVETIALGSAPVMTCTRIVAASSDAEVRLERSAGEADFDCRIVKETQGSAYLVSESRLMLRKTNSIAPEIFLGGAGRIVSREYFRPDEDGMPTFTIERLAGWAGGEK